MALRMGKIFGVRLVLHAPHTTPIQIQYQLSFMVWYIRKCIHMSYEIRNKMNVQHIVQRHTTIFTLKNIHRVDTKKAKRRAYMN